MAFAKTTNNPWGAIRGKAIIKQTLRRSEDRIERRLRDRAWAPQDKPMLCAKNIHYELASRHRAITAGGIGAMQQLAQKLGLAAAIDQRLKLLKIYLQYSESDHVLNLAHSTLAVGACIEDLELLQTNEVFPLLWYLRPATRTDLPLAAMARSCEQ